MTVTPYYDVWCDYPGSCGQWCESATSSTAKEARRRALRAGWTHTRKGGDRCPAHPYTPGERPAS